MKYTQASDSAAWSASPEPAPFLQRLTKAAGLIHSLASVSEVVQTVTEEARLLIGAHRAKTRLTLKENGRQVVQADSVSEKFAAWRTLGLPAIHVGIEMQVCRTNRPLRLTQAELLNDPGLRSPTKEPKPAPPLRGCLAVPLLNREANNIGVILLTDKLEGDFNADDEALLLHFGRMAAVALENAWLFQALELANEALLQRWREASSPLPPLSRPRSELIDRHLTPRSRTTETSLMNAEHAIITLAPDEGILDWNTGAEQLFGYRRAEVIGKPFALLVPPHDRDAQRDLLRQIAQGEDVSPAVSGLLHKDGRLVEVCLTLSPFRDADENFLGVVLAAHAAAGDQPRPEQQQQTLKLEALGQLVGTVAHDFNNMLTVILGSSEMLLGGSQPQDAARALLAEIHKAGLRAETLTRQLAALSRTQGTSLQALDLNEVVSVAEKKVRRLLGEHVLLTLVRAPELGRVKADPAQMQQVLLQLAMNARAAMPAGGTLAIETANVTLTEPAGALAAGSYVTLALRDTGAGMDAATAARILEPLSATKEAGQEIGLGLAMVQSVVKKCGGHLTVATELGRGSTFKIHLPQVAQRALTEPAQDPQRTPPRNKETVLLVEDEDAVRTLTCRVLQNNGYQLLEARSGKEALALAKSYSGPIHLLVSDVQMPYLSGYQLAERLLQQRPQLAILFLSGYPSETLDDRYLRDAKYTFLQKPFSAMSLLQNVRKALDQQADNP